VGFDHGEAVPHQTSSMVDENPDNGRSRRFRQFRVGSCCLRLLARRKLAATPVCPREPFLCSAGGAAHNSYLSPWLPRSPTWVSDFFCTIIPSDQQDIATLAERSFLCDWQSELRLQRYPTHLRNVCPGKRGDAVCRVARGTTVCVCFIGCQACHHFVLHGLDGVSDSFGRSTRGL
jgi:hypothetical protein